MNFYEQIEQERKVILDKIYEIESCREFYWLYNNESGMLEKVYREDESIDNIIGFLQGQLLHIRDREIEFEMLNRKFYGNNS